MIFLEIKISNKTEQPLLSRTQLDGILSFDSATPSRTEVTKKIAEAMKTDLAVVTVSSIDTDFGQKSAKVTAHIYKTKEDLAKYVSKTVQQRHAPKKSKEATEEPETKEKPVAKAATKPQAAPKKDEKPAKAADTKPEASKKAAAENKKPETPKEEKADKKPEGSK